MRKVICQCGQQVRATADMEGCIIQCARCGKDVHVPSKPIDKLSAPGLHPELNTDIPVLFHHRESRPFTNAILRNNAFELDEPLPDESLTAGKTLVGFAFSIAGLCLLSAIVIWWPFLRGQRRQPANTTIASTPIGLSSDKKTASEITKDGWSNNLLWNNEFSQVPHGNEIKELANLVVNEGRANNAAEFWSLLDLQSFDNRVVGPDGSWLAVRDDISVISIVNFLKSQVLDSVSAPETSGVSTWDIVGVHQKGNEVGVLVRYFNDPWAPSDLFDDQQMLSMMQRICTYQDIAEAGKDLLRRRISKSNLGEGEKETQAGMFTPHFGYVVLLFEFIDGDIKWVDLVPFPSVVPISRASGTLLQKDWVFFRHRVETKNSESKRTSNGNGEAWIDLFGEYSSTQSYPFADTLIFSKTAIDQSIAADLSSSIYGVSQDRSKHLLKIAHALRTDPSPLSKLITSYAEKFPSDISADALAVSMWFQHWDSRSTDDSKIRLGRVLLETIARLQTVTSDPFLLDLEFRIRRSMDPNADLVDLENELQLRRLNSSSLLLAKIQRACELGSKRSLLQAIRQLNDLWISQPGVAKDESTNVRWDSIRNNWMPYTN